MTSFKATYSEDYKDTPFVEAIISQWKDGKKSFQLKSSGSTGTPKETCLSRELLVWSAKSTKAALDLNIIDSEETVLCCLPVQKTGGFMQLIRSLHFGWHIHFVNPTVRPFENLNEIFFIDQVSLSPQQLSATLEHDYDRLSEVIGILVGGAPISSELYHEIVNFQKATGSAVWETYGMTETASNIAMRRVGHQANFIPHPDVSVSLDEGQLTLEILPLKLHIKTNDLATLHPNGIEILGRVDDVINSGGVKIHPALVEPRIKEILLSASIERPFYLGKKSNTELGEHAVLVVQGASIKDSSHLLEILKRELPAYHNPKEIIFVAKVAYTDTGKVVRDVVL